MPLDWFRTDWNRTIHFGTDRPARQHMLDRGWADDEPSWTWTDGSISRLAFRLPEPQHETFLAMDCSPFTAPLQGLEQQSVEVSVNGHRLQTDSIFLSKRTVLLLPVARGLFQRNPLSVVSLTLPDAQCPASLQPESHDARKLGLRLRSLTWADIWYDYQPGQRIMTNDSQPSNRFFLHGWSYPETEFIWTDGPTALIVLRVREENGPLTFRAKIHIFWPAPDLPPLVISLFANGQFAGEVAIRTGETGWIEIPISRDCRRKDGLLYLRFEIQTPRAPTDFGLADSRQLGFALSEFVIEPEHPRTTSPSVAGWLNKHVSQTLSAALAWGAESDHLNVPLSGCAADPSILIYGWGEPDAEGTPINRGTAIVAVDLSPHASFRMRMECVLRYSCSNPLGNAVIRVFLNELPAAVWDVEAQGPQAHSLTVWPAMIQTERSTYIRFEVTTPVAVDYSLNLKRMHFSPLALQLGELIECPPEKWIHFGKDRRTDEILGHGWTAKTAHGALSDGYESTLLFKPGTSLPACVQFEISPSDTWPTGQRLLIEVNGRSAAQLDLRAFQTAIIQLTPQDFLHHHWLEFRFIAAPVSLSTCRAASGMGTPLDQTILAFTLANPSSGVAHATTALAGAKVPGSDIQITEDLIKQTWIRYDLTTFQKRLKVVEANAGLIQSQTDSQPSQFMLRSMLLQIDRGGDSWSD